MIYKVPMIKPDLTHQEFAAVKTAVEEGEIGAGSKYIQEFEEKLADYLGKRFAIVCNSGYSALLLACRAVKEILGVKKITIPTFTMVGSVTAAKHAGLEIEFIDVNERGLAEGDYETVMPVDIYGIQSKATGGIIIEDAAEYFGPFQFKGTITCFSFYVNKVMTTGVGGVCITNDENLAKEMKLLRHHYYDGKNYSHAKDGYNLTMSGMQAALGLAQLRRIEEILEKRRFLGERYVKELNAWICESYWYQPLLMENKQQRNELKEYLIKKNIASREFFPPMHEQPPFLIDGNFSNAKKLSDCGILLPLYSTMILEEQDYVIEAVKEFLNT